nr:uncharacterized protein LOC127292899 [Lolium perenne]
MSTTCKCRETKPHRWAEVNIRNNHSSGGIPATILIEERASSSGGARWHSAATSAVSSRSTAHSKVAFTHSRHARCLPRTLQPRVQLRRSSVRDDHLGPGTVWLPGAMAWRVQRWLGRHCCGGVHLGGWHSVRRVVRADNCGLPCDLACWSPIWATTYIVHAPLRNWHFILEI